MTPPLPELDAPGVHDLDGVRAGGAEQPGRVLASPLALAGIDEAEQILIVAEQDEEATVDDGSVFELPVREASHERRHGRVEHGRVTQSGVSVPGRERRGNDTAYTRAWNLGRV